MVTPTIAVLGAWALFGGTHLLLSWPPIRQRLTNRLGDTPFITLYAGVATASLVLLAVVIAHEGGHGPRGLNLAAVPAAKWGLGAVAFAGTALAMAGLAGYPKSAMAVLARRMRASHDAAHQPLPGPTPIERVTRHPFFIGLALVMTAHALLAKTLAMMIFFGGFAFLTLVGISMQDRKLRQRHGSVYGDFENATSVVPFARTKSQSSPSSARPVRVVATAILGAALVGALHPLWQLGHGAWFAVAVAIGGLFATARQVWRARAR